MATDRSPSLTRRMLVGVGLPMAALAILLGIGGALMVDRLVERINDRVLGACARAIADTLTIRDGRPGVEMPRVALEMAKSDERHQIHYNARIGGTLLAGSPDVPAAIDPPAGGNARIRFFYARYRGSPVRIAAIERRIAPLRAPVIVEVAETLETRHALRNRMLIALASFECLLLALLLLPLPLVIRWGLSPLGAIRREIASRHQLDFMPLPVSYAPVELRVLILGFNGLIARLEAAVEGIRRFTADASHQMRTPLTILKAHVDVLEGRRLEDPVARQSVADIAAATQRLQRLLTQLLALARADSARENAVRSAPADLVALARDMAADHAPAALRAGIDLEFEGAGRIAIRVNEVLLAELAGNLVDNAIRYNRPGGRVRVVVRRAGGAAMLIVEDDGPGIPAEARESVFTRFSRLDRDQGRPGSGLGLAIVRALAEAIGAEVTLGASPWGGLAARVRLAPAPGAP
jgi:two-component system sensor histidine kinase TctE